MSNYYLVDAYNGWFVCYADNIREARKQETYEFGRGMTKEVRRALSEEVENYCREKGIDQIQTMGVF